MRASRTIITTLREDPADAQIVSHRLLLRAGLIVKQAAGLYHFLPLGLRVLRRIENIVREEMDAAGALECLAPILTPAKLWQRSERWDAMGKELFRVKDRHEIWSALGPTHEEAFTECLAQRIRSYKELPKNVYQIHTKFRDEIRPRFGMIRAREFVMKDAYSFHADEKCLEQSYAKMRQTYRRIFARLQLKIIAVEADSGAMGGSASEEFMAPAEVGEELLLISESGSYRSNREKTPVVYDTREYAKIGRAALLLEELKKLHTPDAKSIAQVAQLLQTQPDQILKAVLYMCDAQAVIIFMRGDRELNEAKLKNCLQANTVRPASIAETTALGLVAGFIGPPLEPLKLHTSKLSILWDRSVQTRAEWIIGGNETDYHYSGYVIDVKHIEFHDLALAHAGDQAPNGDGRLQARRGIELGHIFKLGRKYTEAFDMQVLDKDGKSFAPYMGCYGIGLNRSMATIVEEWHDERGICWPISSAPYEMVLIGISDTSEQATQVQEFYQQLRQTGCDVLWDERELRPGVKFMDAELIGFPIRITIGKQYFTAPAKQGIVEVQLRQSGKMLQFKGSFKQICQEMSGLRNSLYQELEPEIKK